MDTHAPFSLIAIVDTKTQLRQASNAQTTSNAQRSAEQLARDPVTLRAATPLYDNLIANLEAAARQHPQGNGFIEYITKSCFFDNILIVDVYGERLEKPIPLAVKMERLLETAKRQRELHIRSSRRSANTVLNSLCIEPDGMRNIFNNWRAHPEKWMKNSTLAKHKEMLRSGRKQDAHKLAKKCFNAYLFHLSGCKFLLHKLIELPLVNQIASNNVEQPVATILEDLMNSYEEHKNTPQYSEAVKRSKNNQEGQKRLSHKIWWAQYEYTQGRSLATKVQSGELQLENLNENDQKLVEAFESRQSAKA